MDPSGPVRDRIRGAREWLRTTARSSRGKDVLLYLLFVFVAFVFWLMLSLDAEITKNYTVPLRVTDVPDSVHVIGSMPASVNATVKGKGAQLFRFRWGGMPVLKLKFQDYSELSRGRFYVSALRLEAAVSEYFGNGVDVTAMTPDSVSVAVTSRPGIKLPVKLDIETSTNIQYTMSGDVKLSVDSVTLYSLVPLPSSLKSVKTAPIRLSDLQDTTRVKVKLEDIPGVKISPSSVTVTIPVEPLIAKNRQVPVEITGLPAGVSMITFPQRVSISYLVPMSEYTAEQPIHAYVDYSAITPGSKKVPVTVTALTAGSGGLTFSPDSVEYIIVQK